MDKVIKILDIEVNYGEAVKKIAAYRNAIDQATAAEKALKQQLKEGKISQEEYNSKLSVSAEAVKANRNAISALSKQVQNNIKIEKAHADSVAGMRAKLSNLKAAYDNLSKVDRESAKGLQLKKAINEVTKELKTAEKETQRFYRNVGNYPSNLAGGFVELDSAIGKARKSLMGFVGIVSGAALAKGFGTQIMQVGRSFEDGMARVNAVTNATEEQLRMMGDEAKRLGGETMYTAGEAANALENLTRNGKTAEEATSMLSGTLKLAQSNVIGLADAADITTNNMNAFHLSTEQQSRLNDVLSRTCSSSATNLLTLAEALKNAAPLGFTLNQSIEEVNAALGTLADVGLKGSDAGTKYQQVLLGLASPTAKQQKAFNALGVDISATTIETEGLIGSLKILKEGLSSVTEDQKIEYLGDIFGRRAAPAALTFINNIEKMDEKLAILNEAAGTTGEMFEKSIGEGTTAIKTMQSAWESLLIKIYEGSESGITEPIELATSGIRYIRDNLDEVVKQIGTLVASVGIAKFFKGIIAQVKATSASVIANADATTAQVEKLEQEQLNQKKRVEMLKVEAEQASSEERRLIENKLVIEKKRLADSEIALNKAKTAEVAANEEAAAMATANGWKAAFLTAKMGVQSFVATTKTVMKGFVFTAVIMLALEVIQKFAELLDFSGVSMEGFTGKVKTLVKDGLDLLIKTVQNVVNWFVELYNNSLPLRILFQGMRTDFNLLVDGFKLGLNIIVDLFKLFGNVIADVARVLDGLFTLDFGNVKEGIKSLGTDVMSFFKEATGDVKNSVKEMESDVLQGIADVNKKLEPVVVPVKVKKDDIKSETENIVATIESDLALNVDLDTASLEELRAEFFRLKKLSEELSGEAKATASELMKTVDEAIKAKGGSSGGDGGSILSKKQAEAEKKALQELQKAMEDIILDGTATRRKKLEERYDGEIALLKKKLEDEARLSAKDKTLTEAAIDAINKTIIAKEEKKDEELRKLDEKETLERIKKQNEVLNLRLNAVRNDTEQEKELRLELLKNTHDQELYLLQTQYEEEERANRQAFENKWIGEEEYNQRSEELYDNYVSSRVAKIESYQNKVLDTEQQFHDEQIARQKQVLEQQIENIALQEEEQRYLMSLAYSSSVEEQEKTEKEQLESILSSMNETEAEKLRLQMEWAEQRLQAIEEEGQRETETEEQYNARKLQAQKDYLNAKKNIVSKETEISDAHYKAEKTISSGLSSLLDEVGESNEAFAKMSKIITLGQIAVDTGRALSSGIASAMAVPYPANIAAVATTVATVMGNIASAISTVKSAKFAKGIVSLEGPGTETSDSIPAMLSKGESVITAKATKQNRNVLTAMNEGAVFEIVEKDKLVRKYANGVVDVQPTKELYAPMMDVFSNIGMNIPLPGISDRSLASANSSETLADAFVEAAMEIRPVVAVTDIQDGMARVNAIETLDTI